MKTFVLEPGANLTRNGLNYKPGEAINTNMDLGKLFPHRVKVAPKGVEGTRWPLDVNDVAGAGKFAVIANASRTSFRIVDADGVMVKDCGMMTLAKAVAKYRELMGEGKKEEKKETKKEVKKEVAPPADDDDGDDDADGDDDGDSDDADGEDSEKDADDDDGDDDDEDDAPPPPPKKDKTGKKKKGDKKNRK